MCIEGAHADGHHFIPHAISQGTPLIIAKLMVPGAELALYTDADPMDEDLAHLYQEPFYRMAENDKLTMDACSDEMTKWYDKAQGFGQKNRLKETDIEDIQMAGAMRCISSALNYNFDHWERFDGVTSLPALPRPCTPPLLHSGNSLCDATYTYRMQKISTSIVYGAQVT